jgi:hypothetical protein
MVVDVVVRTVAAVNRREKVAMSTRTSERLELWAGALFLIGLGLLGAILPHL